MNTLPIDGNSAAAALGRLIEVAQSDTGQSARVANFLLAWWNGLENGHFAIADVFALDRSLGQDIATIIGYIACKPAAIYADAFGYREQMVDLVHRWRSPADAD